MGEKEAKYEIKSDGIFIGIMGIIVMIFGLILGGVYFIDEMSGKEDILSVLLMSVVITLPLLISGLCLLSNAMKRIVVYDDRFVFCSLFSKKQFMKSDIDKVIVDDKYNWHTDSKSYNRIYIYSFYSKNKKIFKFKCENEYLNKMEQLRVLRNELRFTYSAQLFIKGKRL